MAEDDDFRAVCDFIRFLLFPDIYTPCGISKDSIFEVKRINGVYRNNAETTVPVIHLSPWLIRQSLDQRNNISIGRVNSNGTVTATDTDNIYQHSPSFSYREDIIYRPLTSVTTISLDCPSVSQSQSSGLLGFKSGSLFYTRTYMNSSLFFIPTTSYHYRGASTTLSTDTSGFDHVSAMSDFNIRLVNICEIAELKLLPISYYGSVFINNFPTTQTDTMICYMPDAFRGSSGNRTTIYAHMTNYYEIQYDKMLDPLPVNVNAPEGIGMISGEHIMNSFQKSVDIQLVLNLIEVNKYSLMYRNELSIRLSILESDLSIIEKRWAELRSERAHAVEELEESLRKQQENPLAPDVVDLGRVPVAGRLRM